MKNAPCSIGSTSVFRYSWDEMPNCTRAHTHTLNDESSCDALPPNDRPTACTHRVVQMITKVDSNWSDIRKRIFHSLNNDATRIHGRCVELVVVLPNCHFHRIQCRLVVSLPVVQQLKPPVVEAFSSRSVLVANAYTFSSSGHSTMNEWKMTVWNWSTFWTRL